MDDEALRQAAADADTDLAQLEGVDPDELRALLRADTDGYADLECDHGAALADELAGLTETQQEQLRRLSDTERAELWRAEDRG